MIFGNFNDIKMFLYVCGMLKKTLVEEKTFWLKSCHKKQCQIDPKSLKVILSQPHVITKPPKVFFIF